MSTHQHVVVYVTVPTQAIGETIAHAVVEQKLVACVNILPKITSIYHWQGAIEKEQELLLIIKTTAELFDAMAEVVAELHPYEVPEVVAVPIVAGRQSYLDWISESTK